LPTSAGAAGVVTLPFGTTFLEGIIDLECFQTKKKLIFPFEQFLFTQANKRY